VRPVFRHLLLLLSLLLACSTTAVPTAQSGLEGSWQLTFWAPASTPHTADSVIGVLELHAANTADSAVLGRTPNGGSRELIGGVQVDFAPMLGRQVSCLSQDGPPPRLFFASPDSITVAFTPGAADCGLWATGRVRDDVVSGTWSEPTFAGHGLGGRFRMVRASVALPGEP
jgi:hypothetical protein